MIAQAIYDHIKANEFQPFTIVLANGERIEVKHRDSVTLPSIEVRGKRFYSSSLNALETRDNEVIEHVINLQLISKIETHHRLNGHNGTGNN